MFNYYNTTFSLEITSKVQKVNQKYTYTQTNHQTQLSDAIFIFFSSTVKEWNARDCGISKAAKDTSMLLSKIDQIKVSHETGSEANFGFGRALMPSYLGMLPPKAAFFSFWMQPRGAAIRYSGSVLLRYWHFLPDCKWPYYSSQIGGNNICFSNASFPLSGTVQYSSVQSRYR